MNEIYSQSRFHEDKRGCVRQPFYPPECYAHIAPGLEDEIRALPAPPEGHISPEQAEFLYALVRFLRAEFVAETGLCVGHSACVVMRAQQSVGLPPNMLSIDNCQFPETRKAAEYLKDRFSGFVFVEGDSAEVLSTAVNSHLRADEGLQLNLALVDGSHEQRIVENDLDVFAAYLCDGGFIWLDDFGKVVPNFGVNAAGRKFAAAWGSCHMFRSPGNRGVLLHQKRN